MLLTPLSLGRPSDKSGSLTLHNRVVMAPLTRCRAAAGHVPDALNAEYYRQRAGAGLIVSEATPISPQGQGYPDTPGIYNAQQVAGWQLVTNAVHAAGGRIVLQLWHVGRISHRVYQPDGALPVSASAVTQPGKCRLPDHTHAPYEAPRALETTEIPGIVASFAAAAARAREAGFDGVEVHGANGYLLDQFIRDGTNVRTDEYGGSIGNRIRFALEVTAACVRAWPAGRVGIRLSPNNMGNGQPGGADDSDPLAVYSELVRKLDAMPLAYLHIMNPWKRAAAGATAGTSPDVLVGAFRKLTTLPIITNVGFTQESAEAMLASGDADAVAFGKLFISNPDLAERFAEHERGDTSPLNPWDETTFYTRPGMTREKGYTDYPPRNQSNHSGIVNK